MITVMMRRRKRMALIEPCSGFRNRKLRRTAQLKVTNGCHLQSTLVTGAIIAKRVLEFSIIKTETSMKACGQSTNDMDRVPTGEMKTKS
jgi:hypothetical protein